MPDSQREIAELEERLAVVRANLTESIEQAAAFSGAADEALYADRIAALDAEHKRLMARLGELRQTGRPR